MLEITSLQNSLRGIFISFCINLFTFIKTYDTILSLVLLRTCFAMIVNAGYHKIKHVYHIMKRLPLGNMVS